MSKNRYEHEKPDLFEEIQKERRLCKLKVNLKNLNSQEDYLNKMQQFILAVGDEQAKHYLRDEDIKHAIFSETERVIEAFLNNKNEENYLSIRKLKIALGRIKQEWHYCGYCDMKSLRSDHVGRYIKSQHPKMWKEMQAKKLKKKKGTKKKRKYS